MNKNIKDLTILLGINEIYGFPNGKLYPTTVLAKINGNDLTVSQLLKVITEILKFIKDNFDVNKHKYSVTIATLKTFQLVLNQKPAKHPTKEEQHLMVDVFHEIQEMRVNDELSKKRNDQIADVLNYLIDLYSVD